jgi:hypothetical protein
LSLPSQLQFEIPAWVHLSGVEAPRSHTSFVHLRPSLHRLFVGVPCWHDPPEHASPDVQVIPSLHGAVLFVCTQPVAGLHESSVQTLPSLQLRTAPVHAPLVHASFTVHALPSLHAPPFGTGLW